MEFVEVGDRCWVGRSEELDVNVSVIAGERGLVVVDTNLSTDAGRTTLDALRRLSPAPVLNAVNTHHHFDHTFGNAVFAEAGAELLCHDEAAALLRSIADDPAVVPDRTFSSAVVLDLGDRSVELIHPGRGHTAGDIVARVPDADVLFAGDLVEESALRSGVPGFGDDCYPMAWPASLDLVLGLLTAGSVVVPGHGAPVDKEFVEDQRTAIGVVAETIRHLAGQGVPVDDAVASAEWPYPREELTDAVRRGYEQLPRSGRSLPLI